MSGFSPKIRFFAFLSLTLTLSFLFSCGDDENLSDLTGIIEFEIDGYTADFTIDQSNFTITNGTDSLPFATDVSALIAVYETVEENTVTVNDVEQENGVTPNDFSSPVNYTVIAEDGTAVIYSVSVNVSLVDPETVSWNKIADEEWEAYEIIRTVFFDDQIFAFGYTKNPGSFASEDIVGTYTSTDGVSWTEVDARDNQYNYVKDESGYLMPQGRSVSIVAFDDKLWSIGGWVIGRRDENGNIPFNDPVKDVWSSADGISWTRNIIEDGFSKREAVTALNYDGKLWVIGGNGVGSFGALGSPLRDVWSSTDGINYDSINANPEFPARTAPAAVVFDNKMWLIGGADGGGVFLNDVWSSTNGVTWTQESAAAGFPVRKAASAFVFNEKLFLLGGEGSEGEQYADMWVSEDGATWTKVADTDVFALPNTFTGRSNFGVAIDGLNIYIIGGKGPIVDGTQTYLSEVWAGKGVE